jgi:hypothetical protein
VRVGFPSDPFALRRWARRNPRRVKDLGEVLQIAD